MRPTAREENTHPGYAKFTPDQELDDLIKVVKADAHDWPTTAIVVTYDELGGPWDHLHRRG